MRILIVKLSSLGDLFHALPVVHELKTQMGAEIDWVTQKPYLDLVGCCPHVDRVIVFPRKDFLRGVGAFRKRLREREYDLVVDLQGLLKSAVAARCARATKVIGPAYHREGSRWLYHSVAGPHRPGRHAVLQAMDVLETLGLTIPETPQFPIAFPAPSLAEAGPRIALAPISRWATKNWPPDRFADVGAQLVQDCQATIYLVGAPEDRPVCDELSRRIPGAVNRCGQTSLVEMGSLISGMDLAITVDTGPMHVAAACGVPTLAVFGATDPGRTGPYGEAHRVVTLEGLDCRPCLSRACARGDLACLEGIEAARVVGVAKEMLAQAALSRPPGAQSPRTLP